LKDDVYVELDANPNKVFCINKSDMPFDFETVPSGEAIFPSHLYRDDGVYLCRSIQAIRAYKFEGGSLHDKESVRVSNIRERPDKEKLTVKQRKKLDSTYQQIGESLDIMEQISLFDKKRQHRIEEESKRRVRHDISELIHQRGEYEGDDEILASLDALHVRTVEITKLVERVGEKVHMLYLSFSHFDFRYYILHIIRYAFSRNGERC
jgi:hypothetical protein